jgi:hypothetical protein
MERNMRIPRLCTFLFLLILSIFAACPVFAGMGQPSEEKRDPILDELDRKIQAEALQMRKEMADFKISHARVDCEIKVDDRFFSSKTTLNITIPKGANKFPLLIFEDFEIKKIDLAIGVSLSSVDAAHPGSITSTPSGETKLYQDLGYTRTVPPLNKEADGYREKNGLKFEKMHFNDGLKVSRLPHIIRIEMPSDMPDSPVVEAQITLTYSGNLDRMDQHPFTKSQVFLNGGDFWIPCLFGEKPTTEIKVRIDRPWHVFTQGRLISEKMEEKSATYEYASDVPQIEPVIITGSYRVDKEKFQGIDIYGFYFGENEAAKNVMEKSKEYIGFFSELLGQYPFESFAIIESPAPVGYGYPSFTAIGTLVMQMHFAQPFALGHEILHNWWGNYVEVPSEKGNWCEALTTYMSNYHYVEVKEGADAALHERRRNLENLSIYLGGKDEFPLKDFEYNKGNIDQIVGYTKGFFLFHESRRIMGDDAFFKALRNFYAEYGGREASWMNILEEFKATASDKSPKLEMVFQDFLNELGIPKINLEGVVLYKETEEEAKYKITGNIALQGAFRTVYNFPYVITFGEGDTVMGKIDLAGESTPFEFTFEQHPRAISFDPEMNVCRFIPEIDRALNMNRFYDNLPACVLVPKNEGEYKTLAESVQINDGKPQVSSFNDFKFDDSSKSDLLVFTASDDREFLNSFLEKLQVKMPDGFIFESEAITANGNRFDGKDIAVLITVANPLGDARTVTILYSTSMEELKKARGRLRFYGDYGWVLFKDVKAVDKGNFPPENITLTERFKTMVTCSEGMCVTEDMTR